MADISLLFNPYTIDGSTPNDGDNIHVYLNDVELSDVDVDIIDGNAVLGDFDVPPGTLTFTLDSVNLAETGLETGLQLNVPSSSGGVTLGIHTPNFFLPLTLDPTIIISEISNFDPTSRNDPGSFIELYNTTDNDIKICDTENNNFYHIQICPYDGFNCNPENTDYPIIPIRCIQSSPVDDGDSDFDGDYPNYYIPSKDRFLLYTGINSNRYTNGWNTYYPDLFEYPDEFVPKISFKTFHNNPDGNGGQLDSTHRLKFQLEHYFNFTSGRCEDGICNDGHWDGNACTGNKDCGVYSGYSWNMVDDNYDNFLNYDNSFTFVIYNGNPNFTTESFPGEIIYKLSQELNFDNGKSKEFIGTEWENSIEESEDVDNWYSVPEMDELEYHLPFPPIKCEDSYIYTHGDIIDGESFTKGFCQDDDKWYKYNYGTLSCVNSSGQIIDDCSVGSLVGESCHTGDGTCYGQWLVPGEMVFRFNSPTPLNFNTPLSQNFFSCTGDCLFTGDCVDLDIDEIAGVPNVCESDTTLDCIFNEGECFFSDCSDNDCDNLYSDVTKITDSCGDCITPECFNSPDGDWMSNLPNIEDCTGGDFYTVSVGSCIADLLTYNPSGIGNELDPEEYDFIETPLEDLQLINGFCDVGFCNGGRRQYGSNISIVHVDGHPCTQDSDCGEFNWRLYFNPEFNSSCNGCRDENGGMVYDNSTQQYEPVTLDSRPDTDCRRIPEGTDNICCNYYVELWLQENLGDGLVDLWIRNKRHLTSIPSIKFRKSEIEITELFNNQQQTYSFELDDSDGAFFKLNSEYLGTPLWKNEGIKLLTIQYDSSQMSYGTIHIINDENDLSIIYFESWYDSDMTLLGYSSPHDIFVDCNGNIVSNPQDGDIGCDGVCTTPLCDGEGDSVNCDSVLDSCGDCNGGCDGTVGGDNCLECGCYDIPDGNCDCYGNVDDCSGTCGGDSVEDNCGVCNNDTSDDCTQDCFGVWGGDTIIDECNVCGGDDSTCSDCMGVPNGNSEIDLCGDCNGIDDYLTCTQGCDLNYCNGTNCLILTTDDCGNCDGDCTDDGTGFVTCGDSLNNSISSDCFGVCGGNSVLSGCDDTCGSTLVTDECNVCGGDGSSCCNNSCTGETPNCNGFGTCVCDIGQDCMGICGGTDLDQSYCPDSDGDGVGSSNSTSIRCSGLDNSGWILVSSGNCTDINDGCHDNLYDGGGSCCPDTTTSVDNCGFCDGNGCHQQNCTDYPSENYNCDGTCVDNSNSTSCDCTSVESGCDNVCGSTLVDDECGICNGSGIPNGDCDCNGNTDQGCGCGSSDLPTDGCDDTCGSTLVTDECNVCGGDNSSCSDCNDVPNGTSTLDNCGVCNNDISDDCEQDCFGVWGGDTIIDGCNVCGGDGSTCTGCTDSTGCNYSDFNTIDDGSCSYPTGDCHDCDGGCGGVDECIVDCSGVCGGTSITDCLGNCSTNPSFIGNTGLLDGTGLDCNNDCDGSSITDCLENCCGGSSGNDCYSIGCDGVCYASIDTELTYPGGSGYLDVCGVCGGNGSPCITISMGDFTLVDDETFTKYSIPLNLSHTSDIGNIFIPFKNQIYGVELTQTPTIDSGYQNIDFSVGNIGLELISNSGGFSAGQDEFTLMTLTYGPNLNNENHPDSDPINDYVSSEFSINPFNENDVIEDNIDINIHHVDGIEYNDNHITLEDSYRKRMVFGCTDVLSNNCNTEECECVFYGFNGNFCTTQSCTPVTHSGQGTCDDDESGENCCCTYPELSISKIVHDSIDYLVSDHDSWISDPFNILSGDTNISIGDLLIYWYQSGWDNYSASSSDYRNKYLLKEVIFPYSFCVDEFDGGLKSPSNENSCTSTMTCGELSDEPCTWTNIRSKYDLNISNTHMPIFNPSDWFQSPFTGEPRTGEYTVRIMWPSHDIDGNFNSYENSILKDLITFNISRSGCTDVLSSGCNYNLNATEDDGYCTYIDSWGTCCPSVGSCNDCNNVPGTTYRWYRDNDMDGYGCDSSYQDLCPTGRTSDDDIGYSYSYPYGNPWSGYSSDKWLLDGVTPGDGNGTSDFWGEGNYITHTSDESLYLKGIEFSAESCGCGNKFYCCNDSVDYTSPLDNSFNGDGTECINILYNEDTCSTGCGSGFICREIHYINDVCGNCGVDWNGGGTVNSLFDTTNDCGLCENNYPLDITLDDESEFTYLYDDMYDCSGECSGTAVQDVGCGFCWGGTSGIPSDYHYDGCNNCQSRYICIDHSTIILSFESDSCNGACSPSDCQRMSNDYNDNLTGESNDGGYFWGLECTACDGTPSDESDSMYDSCNICCQGTTGLECNELCTGPGTSGGCPESNWESFIIGPNTGCSGVCDVLDELDDLGNCCTFANMINFFPDLDESGDALGESGRCESSDAYTNQSECENNGHTWVFANPIKVCVSTYDYIDDIENDIGIGPFEYDGNSIHNCETNSEDGTYPTVASDGCGGWEYQLNDVSLSGNTFNYYRETDDCFGYTDECGDCWSIDQCGSGIESCELYNSNMDCRDTVESCNSELPHFLDECGVCMSPDCQDGYLPGRWEMLPDDSITKTVCEEDQLPGNSNWNLSCTGCTEAGSTNYSGDYSVICDNNTNLDENYCSASSNFVGCCCHYNFNDDALSADNILDADTGGPISVNGYLVNAVIQNGIIITYPTISWSFNGPGYNFYEYYSFDIYRNNTIEGQQCSDEFTLIESVDASLDYPDNSGDYSFIDYFELEYNLTPNSEMWISYYVVVSGQENTTVSNYLGWPDFNSPDGGECGDFDGDNSVYVSEIHPSAEIISDDCTKYVCDYSVGNSMYSSTDEILIKVDYLNIPFTLYDSGYNKMKVSLHGGHYTCTESGGSYVTYDCDMECGDGDDICEFTLEGQILEIGAIQGFPVEAEWIFPFDGNGNNGEGYYCSKYTYNDVQYGSIEDCESACGSGWCDDEHHLLFRLTSDIWDTLYDSGYYFLKIEYPSPFDDPVYLDTSVGDREFMFYINIVEGCMDNNACTCETCPGLCDDCDYVCGGDTPDTCYEYGFYNPIASFSYCEENNTIQCHSSDALCTCTYGCSYPVYGCMDDGIQPGGICVNPITPDVECENDDECGDDGLCGCDNLCHIECFIGGNNDICSIYGESCIIGPSTYISNQSHDGNTILGSVKHGEAALNLNLDPSEDTIEPTIDSSNCLYSGCIDDDAVNFVGSYYDGTCSSNYGNYIECYDNDGDYDVTGWNGDSSDCIFGFQYRLKYQLMINNEVVKLSNNEFYDYIDLGICNECTSNGSDQVLDIQLPLSGENIDNAPLESFGDPEYKLILKIEGSGDGEGYVWLNTESAIGDNIVNFIHQSGELAWEFPDDIEINGASGTCYDTTDTCDVLTESECTCVPEVYSFIIPKYCVDGLSGCSGNSPESEINLFTVTLTHPDDPTISISKTLNVRFIRNNYGVYFELPPLSNITLNVDNFEENDDGDLVGNYEYTIIIKDLDNDVFTLNVEVISGGTDLTIFPSTISSSDIDENGVLMLNIISQNTINSYTVQLTLNQNGNNLQVPEYACVSDGNIIDGTEGLCIADEYFEGDNTCDGIESGSICEWITVPLFEYKQTVKTFTVDVIDTRGPDGDISIKPVETFGISDDTYNYRPVGLDNRDYIGGHVTEYQVPTEYVLPSILYSYGELSDNNTCVDLNDNGFYDHYITIYYGDPDVGGIPQSEYESFSLNVMSDFYAWYTGNITDIYESVDDDWILARTSPLGYHNEGGVVNNCFVVVDTNYVAVFEINVEVTSMDLNPNKGGWVPINAYHPELNSNGNKNDVVWKYELDIQQNNGSLNGFPKIFSDWDEYGSLNCQSDNCFSVPPNDYTGISNVKNFIDNGFTYSFPSNGIYTIIMRAYDILYTPDESAGTNVGESTEILEIKKVIPISQTISNNYLPWQGINIPNNNLDNVINSRESIDFYDIDNRKNLGCFYYNEDNSETLSWEEITKDRYTGKMGEFVEESDTNPGEYSDPCVSQYEYERVSSEVTHINFKDIRIIRGELKSTLFSELDTVIREDEWKVFVISDNVQYTNVWNHYIDPSTCDDTGYGLFGCEFYEDVTLEFHVYISDIKFVPTKFEWTDGDNEVRGIHIHINDPPNGWQVGWNQFTIDMGNNYLQEIVSTSDALIQATNWESMSRMEIYRSGCDGGYLVNTFTPDVDVRTPLSLNGTLSTPIKYYDINLHGESYKETSAPVEVQFYFYKRLEGDIFANRGIIDFPPEGDTYIGFIEWDDGSIMEYDSEPFKIGNGKSHIISHSYGRGGIYNITGYMFTIVYTNAIEGTDILGVNGYKKFTVTINVNGSSTDIYIPYESENNETKSTPVVGGVSEFSIYSKTIKRQLGYIGDSDPLHLEFDQYYDRLYTEYALSQISDKYIGTDMSYYTGSVYDGDVDGDGNLIINGNEELIFNGMFRNAGELGNHPGDIDIGNMRYESNGSTSLYELVGFSDTDAGDPSSSRYWKKIIPVDHDIFTGRDGVTLDGETLIVEDGNNQSWEGGYYYPVLPKLDQFGKFNSNNDLQNSNIPFGSDREWDEDDKISPITNELFRNSRVEVNFTFDSENDGIIEDKGGFNNIGIFISDYRVKFNEFSKEPEDTDIVSVSSIDVDKKAF